MKKLLLLSAIFFLWAATAFSGELPPYNDGFIAGPLLFQETMQTDRGIEMFPNPVTEGRLTIKSEEAFNSIHILNITGEIVFNRDYPSGTNTEVIDLPNLEKGMYLVRLSFTGKPNFTGKVIVK